MATRWEDRDRGDYRDERRYQDRDRGALSRARDEVASWFGDDEAAGRRRMDEMRDDRYDRDRTDRFAGSMERGWDRARDAVRDATDRDRDGRRGMAEWNDNDHRWQGGRDSQRYGSDTWRDTRGGYGTQWNRSSSETRDWHERSYIGRGPRGYQRGDERIREDICDRLTEDPRIDASDMEVQVADAEVTLTGSVRTRDEKHLAENIVERTTGVREVNNNLKVRPPDEVLGTARSGASMLGLTDTPPPEPSSPEK